jgi:hypothetical protein
MTNKSTPWRKNTWKAKSPTLNPSNKLSNINSITSQKLSPKIVPKPKSKNSSQKLFKLINDHTSKQIILYHMINRIHYFV